MPDIIYLRYKSKYAVSKALFPVVLVLILILSLITDRLGAVNDLLRVGAFTLLSVYSIWLLIRFINTRSSKMESALHTTSVFLSVSLMVQGVYAMNADADSLTMIVFLGLGCAGICYYTLINRSREASAMSIGDDTVSLKVIGQTEFNADLSDIESAEIVNENLVLRHSGDRTQMVDLSLFDDLDELVSILEARSPDLSPSAE